MMLVYPVTGAKVQCRANKKYALAVPTFSDGKMGLHVLFRTNDPAALRTRAIREAKKRGRQVFVFRLWDGLFLGNYQPDGSATAASLL